MTQNLKTALAALGLAALLAAPVHADRWDPLRADPVIETGLITMAIAEGLRRYCPSVSPRWIRAFGFARSLQRRALDMGFSRDEIEEYVEDDTEVDRVVAIAEAWFAERGVTRESDAESYCTVGRYEINAESEIGRLLR